MDLYFSLLKKPVFTLQDVYEFYNYPETARSALKKLLRLGEVVRIRRNMYTCISGETEAPVANKYQIACAIHPDACLSHHSAMEYYGVEDQVFYEVYVYSKEPFTSFTFEGYDYQFVTSGCHSGIEESRYSEYVRVTTKERTVIDSIRDLDKIAGIEEVLANIGGLTDLKEDLLLRYLEENESQFLYQKTGFLLYHFRDDLGLSDDFFNVCKSRIGMSKRYLSKGMPDEIYDRTWQMMVPSGIFYLKNGVAENVGL